MNKKPFEWPAKVDEGKVKKACTVDPFPEVPEGILLDYAIRAYVQDANLIVEGTEKSLRPAGYNLRIGSSCYSKGDFHVLNEKQPDVMIDPHEVVVLTMHERLNLPRYLVGRWSIRVKLLYQGLLLVSGPQVDPGFRGNLCCTVFNFSTTAVRLGYMQTFSTIEFAKTLPAYLSPKDHGLDKASKLRGFADNYPRPPPPPSDRKLKDYLPPYVLKSAPAEFDARVKEIANRLSQFQATMYLVLAILFSVLAAVAGTVIAVLVQRGN